MMWSYAILNYQDVTDLVAAVADYVVTVCQKGDFESIVEYMKRQEAANTAWSLAVLQQYPPDFLRLVYTVLLGDGSIDDREKLKELHQDGGLADEYIFTLFYVQMGPTFDGFDAPSRARRSRPAGASPSRRRLRSRNRGSPLLPHRRVDRPRAGCGSWAGSPAIPNGSRRPVRAVDRRRDRAPVRARQLGAGCGLPCRQQPGSSRGR